MNSLSRRVLKATAMAAVAIAVGVGTVYAVFGIHQQHLDVNEGINIGPGMDNASAPNPGQQVVFQDLTHSPGNNTVTDALVTAGGGNKKIQAYSYSATAQEADRTEFIIVNSERVHLNSVDPGGAFGGRVFVTDKDVIVQLGP
ncbi:MAG: hypothetical protein HY706_05215 [Candidatus Hydrogenedentes bacterium]|nr:hypothetical protein [Candidatus Hydrogenedentota bacterium]